MAWSPWMSCWLGMQFLGIRAERPGGSPRWEAQAGKQRCQQSLLMYWELALHHPHLNHKYATNTHQAQSTLRFQFIASTEVESCVATCSTGWKWRPTNKGTAATWTGSRPPGANFTSLQPPVYFALKNYSHHYSLLVMVRVVASLKTFLRGAFVLSSPALAVGVGPEGSKHSGKCLRGRES